MKYPCACMSTVTSNPEARLHRTLKLRHLIIYGIILIQPTAPMGIYGVVSNVAHGHVVTTILLAMVAMLFTAISYGRMARAYPSAGSAYTYVGREIHPALGYLTGWSMVMDYLLNPLICIIWCSKAAQNVVPEIPYAFWAIGFATLFTLLNLRGVKTSARVNEALAAGMSVVVLLFLATAVRYLVGHPHHEAGFYTLPFYDSATFNKWAVFQGTSIAALTYIGFDGISTLSEEVENPRRNILLATVWTCVIIGILSAIEVYLAQLVWPGRQPFPQEMVDTAYVFVAKRVGGLLLFHVINATLLIANIGSGMGTQLGAARLLYGMGRSDALPRKFFGAIEAKHGIPRNNVILIGALALTGAFLLTYERGAELLNFGAFIAFMGVNLAAFVRYYVREKDRRLTHLLPPLLGFLICAFIWLNLSRSAQIMGAIWVGIGFAYGAWRTRGFKNVNLEFEAEGS